MYLNLEKIAKETYRHFRNSKKSNFEKIHLFYSTFFEIFNFLEKLSFLENLILILIQIPLMYFYCGRHL